MWLSIMCTLTAVWVGSAYAASAKEIDIKVDAALERFYNSLIATRCQV